MNNYGSPWLTESTLVSHGQPSLIIVNMLNEGGGLMGYWVRGLWIMGLLIYMVNVLGDKRLHH